MMRRALAITLIAVFAVLYGHLSYAQNPQAGDEAKKKLEAWKLRLDQSLKAEQSVLRQLYTIETEQRRQQQEMEKINARLSEIRSRTSEAESRIEELKRDKQKRARRVNATLRRLYKMGRGGQMQILFESPDLKTFLKRHKALNHLMKNDQKQILAYQKKVQRLASTKAGLSDDLATLASLKDQAQSRKEDIWVEHQKMVILLEQIQRNKALAMRAAKEWEGQDAKIADTIRQLPSDQPKAVVSPQSLNLDFATRKGNLKRPVSGAIVTAYGKTKSERFGTVTKNNGIDFAAALNSPVRVVCDGIVQYVGDFLGYGRVLIIDHGDRYYSLYAHLDRFFVTKGDAVKAGSVIGTVGQSGSLTEPRLHFEIRYKGVAQDPMDWLDLGSVKEEQ